LEQPGDDTTCPALEQESDAIALVKTVAITTPVDSPPSRMESPSPAVAKVKGNAASAEWDIAGGLRVVEPAPEIPSGEPIVPPLLVSTFLPEARLITAGEVAGTPQQRPSVGKN
jgi:hypothetical protein